MKRILTLLVAGVVVAAAAATAPAAEYDRYERGYAPSSPPPRAAYGPPPRHAAFGQTYLVLHGGIFEPNDSLEGLAGYGQGWNFDIGVGSRVSPILAIEGTAGVYAADHGPDEVRVVPVTIGARVVLPNPIIEPYLGGGVGVYFANLDEPTTGINDSDTTVGGYVSLGLDAWLNPRTALNIEAKYHVADPSFTNNVGQSFDVDVSGWAINLGVRFAF